MSLAGRRASAARWIEWASSNRTTEPFVWVHGASVGEGLTAVPVINRLRASIPGVQIALSYTSPSCVSWGTAFSVDRSDYLPLDERGIMRSVFDVLRPTVLICSRGDLWPEMALAAADRNIPIAIVSGTVRPSSRRMAQPVRRWLRPLYQSVSWLGAASDGDASRWSALGVGDEKIYVTGDTRHDHLLERVSNLQPIMPLCNWARGHHVLVAGSTDSDDEKILVKAFSQVAGSKTDSLLLLVPHDCSERRTDEIVTTARRAGVEIEVWSGGSHQPTKSCVVVNMVGVLADIYALAQIAYVGGGFRRGGLHAVSEPAAFAVPVIVGPNFRYSPDAELLISTGGGQALPYQGTENSLVRCWLDWLEQGDVRVVTGLKARSILRQGAANVTVKHLMRLLDTHKPK